MQSRLHVTEFMMPGLKGKVNFESRRAMEDHLHEVRVRASIVLCSICYKEDEQDYVCYPSVNQCLHISLSPPVRDSQDADEHSSGVNMRHTCAFLTKKAYVHGIAY